MTASCHRSSASEPRGRACTTGSCCVVHIMATVAAMLLLLAAPAYASIVCLGCTNRNAENFPADVSSNEIAANLIFFDINKWFAINTSQGGSFYNDSRLGILTEMYIISTRLTSADKAQGWRQQTCPAVGGTGVVPPYDADLINILPVSNCAWVAARNVPSCPNINWLDSSWLSVPSPQPRSVNSARLCNGGSQGDQKLAVCYGWAQTPKRWALYEVQKNEAVPGACTRRGTAQQWIGRADMTYEDMAMPYAMTSQNAIAFCSSVGGALGSALTGTLAATSGWIAARANTQHIMHIGLRYNTTSLTYSWRDTTSYNATLHPPFKNPLPLTPNAATLFVYDFSNADVAQRVITTESATNAYYPFSCARRRRTLVLALGAGTVCIEKNPCTVNLTHSAPVQWYNVVGSHTAARFLCTDLNNRCQAMTFDVTLGSRFATQTGTPSSAGICRMNCTADTASSYGFRAWITVDLIVAPYRRLTFVSLPSGNIYGNATYSFAVTKPVVADSISVTVNNSIVTQVGSWSGATLNFQLLSTVSGTFNVLFTISGPQASFYAPSNTTFTIRRMSTMTTTFVGPSLANELVSGQTLTVQILPAESIFQAVSALVTLSNGFLTSTQPNTTWAAGAATTQNIVFTAINTATDAQSCILTYTYSPATPQFVALPSYSVLVRPKIISRLSGLLQTMGVDKDVSFSVITAVYPHTNVTLTPSCGTATFSPASVTLTTAAATSTASFTTRSTVEQSCSLSVAVSGVFLSFYVSIPPDSVSFSLSGYAAAVAPTTLFALERGQLSLSVVGLKPAETVTVTPTWTGTSARVTFAPTLNPSRSIVFTATNASMNFSIITADGADAGNFTFAVTNFPFQFITTLDPLLLTVVALQSVFIASALTNSISTGSVYATTFHMGVPRLPEGTTTVNVTVSFPTCCFIVQPLFHVWTLAQGSNANALFRVTATAVIQDASFFAITNSSTSLGVRRQTIFIQNMTAYTRLNISVSARQFTTFGTFPVTVTLTVPSAVPAGGLNVSIATFSASDLTPSASFFTFLAGSTSATVTFTPLTQLSMPLTVTFALTGVQNNATTLLLYETSIPSITIAVFPLRKPVLWCNATSLYFASAFAIACNVTIPTLPSSGSLQLTPPTSASSIMYQPSAAVTISTTLEPFLIVPVLPATVTDGSSTTIIFTVQDGSNSFESTSLTWSIVLRRQISITIALVPATLYVGISSSPGANPFYISLTLSAVPPSGVTATVSITTPTFLYNVSSEVFSASTPLTTVVRGYTTTPAPSPGATVRFLITASAHFLSETNAIALTINPLATLSSSVSNGLFFVQQSGTLNLALSALLGGNGELVATTQLYCGAAIGTSRVNYTSDFAVASSVSTLAGPTSLASVAFTARDACASGAFITTLSGTTTIVDLSTVLNTSVTFLALKTFSLGLSTATLYSGGSHSTVLTIGISGVPVLSPSVNLTVLINPPILEFSTNRWFGYSVSDTAAPRATTITAPSVVAASSTVTISLNLAGPAIEEYALALPFLILSVLPIVNVSVPATLTATRLFVGQSLTFTVTCPVAPAGGVVVVAPLFGGSGTAIGFTPSNATLTAATPSATFTVLAMTAATATTLRLVISGTAIQYFPQPPVPVWPLTLTALFTVGLTIGSGCIPASMNMFLGGTIIITVTLSDTPPAGFNAVVVTASTTNASEVSLATPSVTWAAESTTGAQSFILSANAVSNGQINISFTLSADNIYVQTIPCNFSSVRVLDNRAIIWALPSFIYVSQSISFTIQIVTAPVTGVLTLAPTMAGTPLQFSTIPDFSSTTSLSQTATVTGLSAVAAPGVSVTLSILSGAASYSAPAPQVLEVRNLETITVRDLPSAMYVGQSATFTIEVSRVPQCPSAAITIRPAIASTSTGRFNTDVTFANSNPTLRSKELTFTADTAQLSPVALTFPVTGSCLNIYLPLATSASSMRVFNLEQMTFSFPDTYLVGSSFVVSVSDTLRLTLSLGTPAIAHKGVSIAVGFAGQGGSVNFSTETVVFPPGVNRSLVVIRGVLPCDPGRITAVATVGGSFFTLGTLPLLRVLPLVQAELLNAAGTAPFDPTKQLFVVNVSTVLVVSVAALPISADFALHVIVELNGQRTGFSSPTIFTFSSSSLTATVSVRHREASPPRNMRFSLSGSAENFYLPSVTLWRNVSVYAQQTVVLVNATRSLYVGAQNAAVVWVGLSALPTLPGDVITVTLTGSQFLTWNTSVVELTAPTRVVPVLLTGLLEGTVDLATSFAVASVSTEYTPTLPLNVYLVNLNPLVTAALDANFSPVMFVSSSATFALTLPQPPASGTLTVTPQLVGSGYVMVFAPASVNFTRFVLRHEFTLTSSNITLPLTGLAFASSGSPEFQNPCATASIQVNAANRVSLFNFQPEVYIGAANAFSFGFVLRQLPPVSQTLTLTPTASPLYTCVPPFLRFAFNSPNSQSIVLTARASGTAIVEFNVNETTTYEIPLGVRLTVLPLNTFSAAVSNTVVYQGLTTTVSITLSAVPVSPITVNLVLQTALPQNQNALTLMTTSQFSVTPSATLVITGTTALFVVRALATGINPIVSFSVNQNTATNQFDLATLPIFNLRFLALRTISLNVPSKIYVGLPAHGSITLESVPDGAATVTVSIVFPPSIESNFSSQTWSSAASPSTWLRVVPTTVGSFAFAPDVQLTSTIAYGTATTPAVWYVVVGPPIVIQLNPLPTFVYFGEANVISVVIGPIVLEPGERLFVNLTCNSSSVVIFPSQVELSTMQPSFSVWSPTPQSVAFNVSFFASAQRFVLDAAFLLGGRGLLATFLQLKAVFASAPSQSRPFVTQPSSISAWVAQPPSVGNVLIATFGYLGSLSNIAAMPPSVSWTSQSTGSQLMQALTFSGVSPTDIQNVTITFSGDPQYAVAIFSFPVQFQSLLIVTVEAPIQTYHRTVVAVTVSIPMGAVVTISPSFDPPGAMLFTNSEGVPVATTGVQFYSSSSGAALRDSINVNATTQGPVRIIFTLTGQDAANFAVPQPITLQVIPVTMLLVSAPAVDMDVFLAPNFFVPVVLAVSSSPIGTLALGVSLSCTGTFVRFSQSVFFFNASYANTQTLFISGIAVTLPCELLFTVSGTARTSTNLTFTGNVQRFTVRVVRMYNISVMNVPSRVFINTANAVSLTIALDPSTPLPLASRVEVSFAVSPISTCTTISPRAIIWAAQSLTEVLAKTAVITASCNAVNQQIFITVSAASTFYNNMPSVISFDTFRLLTVSTTNPAAPLITNYDLYVSGGSLALDVLLPEPLLVSESLTVMANYLGTANSISQLQAVWLPSPSAPLSKQLLLSPMFVSPVAQLQFIVVGPPRFAELTSGTGTLAVIGPVGVTTNAPTAMVVGNKYLVTVSLGGPLQPSEQLIITPVWYGVADAVQFNPKVAIFNGTTTIGLQATMEISAKLFQAGYRLLLKVSGSFRYTSTAFDDIVTIVDAIPIVSTALPSTLMQGRSYNLGIDITQLPPGGSVVTVQTRGVSSTGCISFSGLFRASFIFNASFTSAPKELVVPVTVTKIFCEDNPIDFVVTAPSIYSQRVPTRYFSTLPLGTVLLDWTSVGYAQAQIESIITLMTTLKTFRSNVTIFIYNDSDVTMPFTNYTFRFNGPTSVVFSYFSATVQTVNFDFALAIDGKTSTEEVPSYNTSFLSSVVISLLEWRPTLYTGVNNQRAMQLHISQNMTTINGVAGTLNISVTTSSSNLTVQPSFFYWARGLSQTQFVYLVGKKPEANVSVFFSLSGTDAQYVSRVPQTSVVSLIPPLVVNITETPRKLYVGVENQVMIFVTVPIVAPIQILMQITGEQNAFKLTPSVLTWTAQSRNLTLNFTMRGMYSSTIFNQLLYILADAPPFVIIPPQEFVGVTVADLLTVMRTPSVTSFSLFVFQSTTIKLTSPATAALSCVAAVASRVDVATTLHNITVRALTPGITTFTCTSPETIFAPLPILTFTVQPRKGIIIPSLLTTYVGVPNTITVTLKGPPVSSTLVVAPNMTAGLGIVSVVPTVLFFGPSTAVLQSFTILGLSETSNFTDLILSLPLMYSGPSEEYEIDAARFLNVSVIAKLNVVAVLTNSVGQSIPTNALYPWYASNTTPLVGSFALPRRSVFGSIAVYPGHMGQGNLQFCSTNPCTALSKVSQSNPILLNSAVLQYVYIWGYAKDIFTIDFTASGIGGGVLDLDPTGGAIRMGNISFRELESVIIDTKQLRSDIFLGANNEQKLTLTISALPLQGQQVEIIVNVPLTVACTVTSGQLSGVGTYLISWTSATAQSELVQFLDLVGNVPVTAATLRISWRDRSATSSAKNFVDGFNVNSYTFRVLPQYVFTTTMKNILLPSTSYTNFTIFTGRANAISAQIRIPSLPVFAGTTVTITANVSNPDVFVISSAKLFFSTLNNNGALSQPISLYAKTVINASQLSNNSLLFTIAGPSEYVQTTRHLVYFNVLPLQVLENTLQVKTIAVGVENAVTFFVYPTVEVDLVLGTYVGCSEVSFTSAEDLSWSGSTKKIAVTLSATGPTSSPCDVRVQVLGGGDLNSFLRVPFSVDVLAAPRPSIVYTAPTLITGKAMAASGQALTLALSGSHFHWGFNSSFSARDALIHGWFSIESTLGVGEQPASVLALVAQQLEGTQMTPFVTVSLDRGNLVIRFMPTPAFQPTAIEQVTIKFTRKAILEGVSLDPTSDSVAFSFKGVKDSLLGSGSSLVCSAAAGAAAAGGAVSMTSATQANKLQTIVNAFKCPDPDWRDEQDAMQCNEFVIPIAFGTNAELGTFAAFGFTNFLVICGVALVHLFASYILYQVRLRRSYNDKSWSAARARVHYPSFLLFPVLFFFQSIVSSSITTVMYSPVLKLRMVGAFTLIVVGFGIPTYTFIVVGPSFKAEYITAEKQRQLDKEKRRMVRLRMISAKNDAAASAAAAAATGGDKAATAKPADGTADEAVHVSDSENSDTDEAKKKSGATPAADAAPPSMFMMLLGVFKPTGTWKDPDDVYWISRYYMFFIEFREGFHWFLSVDITVTFVLGVLDGIKPISQSQCFGRTAGYLLVFFVQMITMMIFRPYNNGFGNIFFITAYFLQFVSMLFVFIAIVKDDQKWGGVSVSINLLLLFSFILLFKTLIDGMMMLNDNFGLEEFFKEKEDKTIKRALVKDESKIEAVMQEEMTQQLLLLEQQRRVQQVQYAVSGVPAYEGKTLLDMEEEMVARQAQRERAHKAKIARKEEEERQRALASDQPAAAVSWAAMPPGGGGAAPPVMLQASGSGSHGVAAKPKPPAAAQRYAPSSDDDDSENSAASRDSHSDRDVISRIPQRKTGPLQQPKALPNPKLNVQFATSGLQYTTPQGKRAFHTSVDKRFEPLLAKAQQKKLEEEQAAALRAAEQAAVQQRMEAARRAITISGIRPFTEHQRQGQTGGRQGQQGPARFLAIDDDDL